MPQSVFAPNELVMMGAAVGLEQAGIPLTVFDPAAPLAACRLCGAIFQTPYHRELQKIRRYGQGLPDPPDLLAKVLDLGNEWRKKHTERNHTQSEIDAFTQTGWAFTPEAANVLAPFGIIPMGNLHPDLISAMMEAPRKPDLRLLEGGE